MDADRLKVLLSQTETPTLEFKVEYRLSGQAKKATQDEIAKDLLALVNSATYYAREAYLIVGAGDRLSADGTRERKDLRASGYSQRCFFDIFNDRCDPPLPALDYDEVEVDGCHYAAITLRESRYTHWLERDLIDSQGRLKWRKHDVLIRRGDSVYVASPWEREALSEKTELWSPPGSPEPLHKDIRELLQKEITYADQQCASVSGRSIDDIYVERHFKEWDPIFAEGIDREPREEGKKWWDVQDQLRLQAAVVLLGDPGSGKTIELLRESQQRCREALATLEADSEGRALDRLEPAVYVRANRLARLLRDRSGNASECIVDLLLARNQPFSQQARNWLIDRLRAGAVLIAVDGLDEVPQSSKTALWEGLSALSRAACPCPLLLSTRRVGYTPPPLRSPSTWLTLPFTSNELRQAISRWFAGEPEQAARFGILIHNTPPLEDLLASPLLFTLACLVWRAGWSGAAESRHSASPADLIYTSTQPVVFKKLGLSESGSLARN